MIHYNKIDERTFNAHIKAAVPAQKFTGVSFPPEKGVRAENEVFSTKSCFIAVADRDLASPTKPDFGLGRSFMFFVW